MDVEHQQRMDRVYGRMKYVYDATRPFFLAGRAAARQEVVASGAASALEVGCGTGRNLILIARRAPQMQLSGLDISSEMLTLARSKVTAAGLSQRIALIEGELADAAREYPDAHFPAILFSYSLSMIPDWQGVLRQALERLSPGGVLVIADFGACGAWPALARWRLYKNLSYFHVTPRTDLPAFLRDGLNLAVTERSLFGGYGIVLTARRESGA